MKGCTPGKDGKVAVAECVGASLSMASNFDPTGLLSVAAAFAKPTCNPPRIDPDKEAER